MKNVEIFKWNWFDKYGGWLVIATIIIVTTITLMIGCVSERKQPIEILPRVVPQKLFASQEQEYQVHMGSHHLINANSIKEAQQFIDSQSASHGGKMRIVYVGDSVPTPQFEE